MKQFTVNKVPFEVSIDAYKQHFILSEVDNESGRFTGIDEYDISDSFDAEDIKQTLTLFLQDMNNNGLEVIDPYSGMKFVVDENKLKYDQPTNSIVNPEIVIEFVDKYIKNPKNVIKLIIKQLYHIDGWIEDILDSRINYYYHIRPIADFINRAIPELFIHKGTCCDHGGCVSLNIVFEDDCILLEFYRDFDNNVYDDRLRMIMIEVSKFMSSHDLYPKFGNRSLEMYFNYCYDFYEIFGNTEYLVDEEECDGWYKDRIIKFRDDELTPLKRILDEKRKQMYLDGDQ